MKVLKCNFRVSDGMVLVVFKGFEDKTHVVDISLMKDKVEFKSYLKHLYNHDNTVLADKFVSLKLKGLEGVDLDA